MEIHLGYYQDDDAHYMSLCRTVKSGASPEEYESMGEKLYTLIKDDSVVSLSLSLSLKK